jgi:hypothetical protein
LVNRPERGARHVALSLLGKCRPIISGAVPTIDLPDDEPAAVTAAIRGVIAGDRYPHAPRLDPLRAALARLDAATADRKSSGKVSHLIDPAPAPEPKASPPAKADKRARR